MSETLFLSTNIAALARTPDAVYQTMMHHLLHTIAKDPSRVTRRDWFNILAYTLRDYLAENWLETTHHYYEKDARRVYYLSMEFLLGRALLNNALNLGMFDVSHEVLKQLGLPAETIYEMENDPALGNGGLGRLAACFLDSMATLNIAGYGYGIRYEFGMFYQRLKNGMQVEQPDNWLRYANPWEFSRPELLYPVQYGGNVVEYRDLQGKLFHEWTNTQDVMAMAYDLPIAGYNTNTVNTLRLWSAKSSRDFNLQCFNHGEYLKAVEEKSHSETLSKVLYPDDTTAEGRQLRLKQEFFFVSASIQDIVRRYESAHPHDPHLYNIADKIAIQLNDTHPVLAIPEMLRLLVDKYHQEWDQAWESCTKIFGYTNHTLMPEALETWSAALVEKLFPRHFQLINEINRRFLEQVRYRFPGDLDLIRRVSIYGEEGEKHLRMAHLAVIGSHKVNGVSNIHTNLMKSTLFSDFNCLFENKIINITNGITPRRWLNEANPELSHLISEHLGHQHWLVDLSQLKHLIPLAENKTFRRAFQTVKQHNKEKLAKYIKDRLHLDLNPNALFDVQVKRIHEYKRQLLNVLHIITRYNRIRANPHAPIVSRVMIFAGKAAPGYVQAKRIIKLINDVADVVNHDPIIDKRLQVVFIPNYDVSIAQRIMPAAELSEQISTAGTEASGTGNMKLSLNGALTIGTRDGANLEICEEVGEENVFMFGLNSEEVSALKKHYQPFDLYHRNLELKQVLDMLSSGYFSVEEPARFKPLVDSLLNSDSFLNLADYEAYMDCQMKVDELYQNPEEWTRRAILNVAKMGTFSSDRTIQEYAQKIWNL
ncbi:MAG: hypothetical protein RIT27_590 [Pseudomonadota bacterium]|jgi:starch phosphorylase